MALEQYFQDRTAVAGETKPPQPLCRKWESFGDDVDTAAGAAAGFDCNICLDTVNEPVVTLCGHLFCWPCIYKWLQVQSKEQTQQCPVCKAEVTQGSLVPLYGRGQTTVAKPSSRAKAPSLGIVVPRRPHFCGLDSPRTPTMTTAAASSPNRGYMNSPRMAGGYASPGGMTTNLLDPAMGVYGEMVYARVFGNSITNLYTYPNSYNLAGSASPRVRRHVMQADRSLSRVCFFLFCCIIWCLVLF